MALRVLLADESSSIKKVMQLALQDFGVEVKSVPIGLDVLPTAQSWKPDIVFADVLLAKRSGYEVATDLKMNPQTKSIPIVLMWSGFMDLDTAKVKSSGAEETLEKPFDADRLRHLVRTLVPQTAGNKIADYLSFPKLPDFVDTQKPKLPPGPPAPSAPTVKARPAAPAPPPPAAPAELEEPEDFTQVPLPKNNRPAEPAKVGGTAPMAKDSENWQRGNLDRFKIQLPEEDYDTNLQSLSDLEDAPIEIAGHGEVALGDLADGPAVPQSTLNARNNRSNVQSETFGGTASRALQQTASGLPAVDPALAEQILREQVRAVLQDIAWKIIPDITEQIVREEIQKLLKDAEKLS